MPYGLPSPCQILLKLISNRRGGTPKRALSVPKRPKGTQRRPKRPPETAKKRLGSALGALLTRFGRALGRFREPNASKMEPKLSQKLSQVVSSRVSHAHFGFHAIFLLFSKKMLQNFQNSLVRQKSYTGEDSLKKCSILQMLHYERARLHHPEKHLQKP